MKRTIVGIFIIALLNIAMSADFAFCRDFVTIDSFQWTNSIDKASRQYSKAVSSPVRAREAYLWMRLRGSPELLKKLQRTLDGKLPVRHKWYRYEIDRISPDIDAIITLSIGRKNDLKKLAYEVDAKGYFYWRIWSGKKNLTRGWWRVDVVDDFDETLQCVDGEIVKPCSFEIEVR